MHQPDWSQSWQYPVPPPSLPWQPGSPVVLSGETKITMHQSEAVGEAEEGGRVEQERTVMDHLLQLFCCQFVFFSVEIYKKNIYLIYTGWFWLSVRLSIQDCCISRVEKSNKRTNILIRCLYISLTNDLNNEH